MATATDAQQLTFSLAEIVKVASPVLLGLFSVIIYLLKRMVAKQEQVIEDQQEKHDKLVDECHKCQAERARDYAHCIDTFGKLCARISNVEGRIDK